MRPTIETWTRFAEASALTEQAQQLVTRLFGAWERETPENCARWDKLERVTSRAMERVRRRWDRKLELQRLELLAIAEDARRLRGAGTCDCGITHATMADAFRCPAWGMNRPRDAR